MAKNLLSKKAIKYIVQLRNDEDVRYSYAQIAELVEKNFGVKVCFQTIAYHYKRNKDIDTSTAVQVKPNLTTQNKPQSAYEQHKAKVAAQRAAEQASKPSQNAIGTPSVAVQTVGDGSAPPKKKFSSRTPDGRLLEDWEKTAMIMDSMSLEEKLSRLGDGTYQDFIHDYSNFD